MTPRRRPDGQGYIQSIRYRQSHPCARLRGKSTVKALGTEDEFKAQLISNDINALFSKPELLQAPDHPLLDAYDDRAVEIALGDESLIKIWRDRKTSGVGALPTLTPDDKAVLAVDAQVAAPRAKRSKTADESDHQAYQRELGKRLEDFTPQNARRLADSNRLLSDKNEMQANELEALRDELARVKRQHNVDVKVTIRQALSLFLPGYVSTVSAARADQCRRWLENFVEFMTAKQVTKLGDLKTQHIDDWVLGLRGERTENLSAPSKAAAKIYVGLFTRWAAKKYELVADPMSQADPVKGAQGKQHIVAIRRLDELKTLIEALKPWPYWRAWVAVATLAGPRWAEQQWLKVNDVYLSDWYIRISTRTSGRTVVGHTKTGKERNVPIERSILLPILRDHLELRREQQKIGRTDGERSELLFPSIVEGGTIKRTKSLPGMWSHNSVWSASWDGEEGIKKGERVLKTAKVGISTLAASGQEGDYWKYGPSEWRHTFGTILGNVGWSTLEISKAMGNSPTVAENYYIASVARGQRERWPLEY